VERMFLVRRPRRGRGRGRGKERGEGRGQDREPCSIGKDRAVKHKPSRAQNAPFTLISTNPLTLKSSPYAASSLTIYNWSSSLMSRRRGFRSRCSTGGRQKSTSVSVAVDEAGVVDAALEAFDTARLGSSDTPRRARFARTDCFPCHKGWTTECMPALGLMNLLWFCRLPWRRIFLAPRRTFMVTGCGWWVGGWVWVGGGERQGCLYERVGSARGWL